MSQQPSNQPQQNQELSRIMHNNWIIDNQIIGDTLQKNSKNKLNLNPTNKSVIIVKPNHGSSSLDVKNNDKLKDSILFNSNIGTNNTIQSGSNHASRSSLRKVAGS
jgi:hypothetical protein